VHETLQRLIKINNIGDNLCNFCGNSSALIRLNGAALVTFADTITSASAPVVGPVTFDQQWAKLTIAPPSRAHVA